MRRYRKRIGILSCLIFLFGSCATYQSTFYVGKRLDTKKLYSVENKKIEDIKGNVKIRSMLIYKDAKWDKGDYLFIKSHMQNGKKDYFLELKYFGLDWAFYDQIELKVNSDYFQLTDDSPSREVISGDEVTETLDFYLNEKILKRIDNSSNLTIQYKADSPVKIPRDGIKAVKNFIQ